MTEQNSDAASINTTVSLRLSADINSKLVKLALHTRRTRSSLANAAIAAYVERELAIVEAVERGLDDMQAGRVTSHPEAMRRLREAISSVQKSQ